MLESKFRTAPSGAGEVSSATGSNFQSPITSLVSAAFSGSRLSSRVGSGGIALYKQKAVTRMNRFFHYQLRTTDLPAANAFYASLLGEGVADIEALPKQAIERGAPAHWLGLIGVEDLEPALRAFLERGATQLGPIVPVRGGGKAAVFRDPGGAVVALASKATSDHASPKPDVIWHQLNAANVSQTVSAYCDLFGWSVAGQRDHGEHGVHQEFAWSPGEPCVGSAVDIAGRAGIHSHWLFHFQVPSLEAAVAKVRNAGGLVLRPTKLENGDRVAMCEDPQGAAFMLHELQATS